MRLEHAFHTHAERLISGGRLTLVLGSLAAILIDPFEPTRFVRFTYLLLIAYCFYAGALVAVVWRSSAHPWPRLTHAVDLAVFSSLVFVTEGPSSPFFVYFVFATVAATMQWSWRGTATRQSSSWSCTRRSPGTPRACSPTRSSS